MAKRVILIIFSAIAAAGLVTMLVGFTMGGRGGSYRSEGRDLYYVTSNDKVYMGKVPFNLSYNYDYMHEALDAPEAPDAPDAPDAPNWHEPMVEGEGKLVPLDADSFNAVDFDIPAGYLTVVNGDEPSLAVNGELDYSVEYDEGVLEIKSQQNVDRFTSQQGSGNSPRFFLGSHDVTTEFTLTLPENMALEAHVDMGVITVRDVKLGDLDLSTSAGSLLVDGCEVDQSEISVDAGVAEIRRLTGVNCELKVDVGSISFEGEVTGTLKADCGLGTIGVSVPQPDNYGWKTEVGLGTISIGGDTYSGGFGNNESRGNNDTLPFFDLECGLGSIDITFT